MKLLFLHLSDLHIKNKRDINYFHIDKITDSLNAMGEINQIVIVLSGDITYSGEKDQYTYAWCLLGAIITGLKKKLGLTHIPVWVVPGNHDVLHGTKELNHEKLLKIYRENRYESELPNELSKQSNFFNYAIMNKCFRDDPITSKLIEDFSGFKIEVNLINTSLFSTRDDDKGLHYLPSYNIEQVSKPTKADFVITVMHHTSAWFTERQKASLERILLVKNSLIFLGHEHTLETKSVSLNNNANVQILAGGILCNGSDWSKSEYYASVLETETLDFSLWEFVWNSDEHQYEHNRIGSKRLPQKPSVEKKLIVDSNFLRNFCDDPKSRISKNSEDYFVFPRIEREERNSRLQSVEFITEKSFFKELQEKKRIIIAGGYNSGKTSLLKHIFLSLSKKKAVIFCNVDSITNKKRERIIKTIFEETYGENPSDYIRFQQMPKKDKVLIIDDFDRIKSEHFDKFIPGLENDFEYIIFSTKQVFELDIMQRMKIAFDDNDVFFRYRLRPFFIDKRQELIIRVVNLRIEDQEEVEKTSKVLMEAIKKQRRFFNFDPAFIIQYVDYYCKNLGDIQPNDGNVFGKVFEANIINSLAVYQNKKLTVDKLFVILAKIAYYIHFSKAYPITFAEIDNVIQRYNNDYGTDVDANDFIRIIKSAKIITLCGDNSEYKFCNKNYLAFFVAKELNLKFNTDGNDKDLQQILRMICFGINADILLFITYITDNPRILRLILDMATSLSTGWVEYDEKKANLAYMQSVKYHEVKAPSITAKKEEEKQELTKEQKIIDNGLLDTVDIYDYSDDTVDDISNQIKRAISLLMIISKSLPSFEHMMLKEDKDKFVEMIYRLPNKIFYLWASEVDKISEEIIKYVEEMHENKYGRHKTLDEKDILKALQWDSMSLLLDLYYLAISNSIRGNTESYLNEFDYIQASTHILEHLMVLEKVENVREFYEEANNLYDGTKDVIIKTMTKRIIQHGLISIPNLEAKDQQRIQEKYFPIQKIKYFPSEGTDRKRMMFLRAKYTNKS